MFNVVLNFDNYFHELSSDNIKVFIRCNCCFDIRDEKVAEVQYCNTIHSKSFSKEKKICVSKRQITRENETILDYINTKELKLCIMINYLFTF